MGFRHYALAHHADPKNSGDTLVDLESRNRAVLEGGTCGGLNEGSTVTCTRLGNHMGSCTFARTENPVPVHRYFGTAQVIGIFAIQAALCLTSSSGSRLAHHPRLHLRPRDGVVLAGRGYQYCKWLVPAWADIPTASSERPSLVGRRLIIPPFGAKAFFERPFWPSENDHGDAEN